MIVCLKKKKKSRSKKPKEQKTKAILKAKQNKTHKKFK